MDKDKNTMHLPTVAKTSIDKGRKFDRGDHVQLLEYLRGEVLDVSKFARSFSRAAVTPWKSSMPSATAHLVALLGHEEKDRHKYDDKEHIAGAIEAARSRGFSVDYFASLLVVVTPDDKVISIVGHRLLEDDIVKQHLHALPKGTYLHWLNFNANKMDKVVVKEILSINARPQLAQVRLEGDVHERTLPAAKVMPRGMYSERANGKSQKFPPSTSATVPFPKSLRHPGLYHVPTLAEVTYAEIASDGKATGISQLGAHKGKVDPATYGRRSRATGAVFFKCPVVSVEATFPIAEAMSCVEAFFEARKKTGWCSVSSSPKHLYEMWVQMLAENQKLKPPKGGLQRLYYGGAQIELGLHPEVETAERISGFQNYGSIHANPTDEQLRLQGNETILFNAVSCVSEHLSIHRCVSVHDS
eukprot:COSAG05_NODE_3524_length_2010_cov_1.819990_1_plen_415_part_00